MPIEFDLDLAHPDHAAMIRATLTALAARYPQAPLDVVRVYSGMPGDRSLGNADAPGRISLNAFWFSQPPEVLQAQAVDWPTMPLGGGREIEWHGKMQQEPAHLVAHEFGHVLMGAIPDARDVAQEGWLADTEDPSNAVSGYALNDADEWWAENCAAHELGVGNASQAVVELLRAMNGAPPILDLARLNIALDRADTLATGTLSKAEVDYRPQVFRHFERCGTCTMFREPDACTLVRGEIDFKAVCDRFDSKVDLAMELAGLMVG